MKGKNRKRIFLFTLIFVLPLFILSACAKSANNIEAYYVSPLQFSHLDCDQIRQEINNVSQKTNELTGQQNMTIAKDSVALGVGLVVFWPALILMAGGDKESEIAMLKGEYDALEYCAVEKQCSYSSELVEARKKLQEEYKAKKEL